MGSQVGGIGKRGHLVAEIRTGYNSSCYQRRAQTPIPAATPIRATPMVPADPRRFRYTETTAVTRKEVTAI